MYGTGALIKKILWGKLKSYTNALEVYLNFAVCIQNVKSKLHRIPH